MINTILYNFIYVHYLLYDYTNTFKRVLLVTQFYPRHYSIVVQVLAKISSALVKLHFHFEFASSVSNVRDNIFHISPKLKVHRCDIRRAEMPCCNTTSTNPTFRERFVGLSKNGCDGTQLLTHLVETLPVNHDWNICAKNSVQARC